MSTTEFTVTGMTCGHCEMSVREEVEQLGGVATVDVSAASGRLVVSATAPIDDAAVIAAAERDDEDAEQRRCE